MTTRCCARCGRWGERGYRPGDDGAEHYVCTNDRACNARRARNLPAVHEVNDVIGGVVMQVTEHWVVAVRPMIYNDRILLMRTDRWRDSIEAAWCYPRGRGAYGAAAVWDPETETAPVGYAKEAFDRRPRPRAERPLGASRAHV